MYRSLLHRADKTDRLCSITKYALLAINKLLSIENTGGAAGVSSNTFLDFYTLAANTFKYYSHVTSSLSQFNSVYSKIIILSYSYLTAKLTAIYYSTNNLQNKHRTISRKNNYSIYKLSIPVAIEIRSKQHPIPLKNKALLITLRDHEKFSTKK